MRLYVDASVLLVAVGSDSADRDACRRFIGASHARGDDLCASVEVVQEFVFHRMRRGGRDDALNHVADVRAGLDLIDFDVATLDLALDLMGRTALRGRDAVHAATALRAGLDTMVSLDDDFADVPGLTLVHPADIG